MKANWGVVRHGERHGELATRVRRRDVVDLMDLSVQPRRRRPVLEVEPDVHIVRGQRHAVRNHGG